jgi:coenzyme Q-binding protein COQ10
MPTFRTMRRVPFSPRQMFDLVVDVERYPEFVPLCQGLRVKSRERNGDVDMLVADMDVGYQSIRETFTSRVTIDHAAMRVTAEAVAGPFSHLDNRWSFRAVPEGCEVEFFISYELSSLMLRLLVGAVFERAFRRFAEAFEHRAHEVYGAERPATSSPA